MAVFSMKTALLSIIIILLLWSVTNVNSLPLPINVGAIQSIIPWPIKDVILVILLLLKFLSHPVGIFADILQLGLEYIEYKFTGKGFGVVGNIVFAIATANHPLENAGMKGLIRWCIVEAVRLAAETFL